jgi:hypothetical protein
MENNEKYILLILGIVAIVAICTLTMISHNKDAVGQAVRGYPSECRRIHDQCVRECSPVDSGCSGKCFEAYVGCINGRFNEIN